MLDTDAPLLSLRRMMTDVRPSGRARLRVLVALAFFMLAQALALNHLVGHTAKGDNAGCAICVSASHAGSAFPASPVEAQFLQLADPPAVPVVAQLIFQSPPAVYRSRAPPASA